MSFAPVWEQQAREKASLHFLFLLSVVWAGLVTEKEAAETAEVSRGGGTAAAAAAAEQLTSQSCREGKPASCLTAEATAEQFNNSLGRKKDGRQRAIAS